MKESIEYLEGLINKYESMTNYCWLCGSSENLTKHHVQPRVLRSGKSDDGLGYIIVCRACHEQIEYIKYALRECGKERRLTVTRFKQLIKTFSNFSN